MLSVSPNSIVRSSLEEMLDALRRRDENEKPKDLPPALPARPKPNSRTRLPSSKRQLPSSLENGDSETQKDLSFYSVKSEDLMRPFRGNSIGAKMIRKMDARESSYVSVSPDSCVMPSDTSDATVPKDKPLPSNPDVIEVSDDLTELSYLNEPSVLQNLQHRYSQDIIYSKAGPVLVSINPFKDVQLHGHNVVMAYRQKLSDGPHVYTVVDTAYNQMMTDETNQSIIISGESGSGKSETAKHAMQYLAELGGGSDGVESKVLCTSCILEAFGNAKTSKNNNSSRFGKLVEIHFSDTGKICGAKLQTFQLEKSRVVQVAQGERSFNIFYQLCAGASDNLRDQLRLKKSFHYKYLNQSNCLEAHDVDYAQELQNLMEALNAVRISKKDQDHAFRMVAAVLWLGNISFLVGDSDNHVEVVDDEAVANASSLIGCSAQDLILALSTSRIQAGMQSVTKRITLQQARDTRDTLAKFIYSSLFNWLVEEINSSFAAGCECSRRSICILDICGFESLENNGFEQFCVNYANERLQQYFNRHVFKLVQEEYDVDGIDWKKVDFKDNQECLNLFEKRPSGLLFVLNEESNSPEGKDSSFFSKLKKHWDMHHCFIEARDETFIIKHYAGEVLYSSVGFVEKNRDILQPEIIQLLLSSTDKLLQQFAIRTSTHSWKPESLSIWSGMRTSENICVATKFRVQLFKLMQQLESTTPHFIRCIKPNSKLLPGVFEEDLVLEQVRCTGVLEASKISRSWYPTRITHQEFLRRYGFLDPEANSCLDMLSTAVSILQRCNILPEMYQIGYTKLFFRAGQINTLEDVKKKIIRGILVLQKRIRDRCSRRHFHELKGGVISLQSYVRGEIARKQCDFLRLKRQDVVMKVGEDLVAAVRIQSAIRGWLVRKNFIVLLSLKQSDASKQKPGRRIPNAIKGMPSDMSSSIVTELQKQVLVTKETLGQKEKENEVLKEQLQQFELRWFEYENKMKSMEEMWQRQMASLQENLAAAKKSTVTDIATDLPRKLADFQSPCYSEELPMETQTPGGSNAVKLINNGVQVGTNRGINGVHSITPLVMEFELRKQNFDSEASAVAEVKSGNSYSINPIEEFRRLKHSFDAWKNDYKVRLREAKAKIRRQGQAETEKKARKWWGKRTKRF